jgi:hypothetical protein
VAGVHIPGMQPDCGRPGASRRLRDVMRASAMRYLGLAADFDKGSGVARAAVELSLALSNLVGIGDAENDHTLLRACGLGVAVANALDSLKDQADLVTHGERGEGVAQLIDRMIVDDLAGVAPRPRSAIGVVPHETDARTPRKLPT